MFDLFSQLIKPITSLDYTTESILYGKGKTIMIQDIAVLNSATKYPSIDTYHHLGERGRLTEDSVQFSGDVVLTEKVDGTNGRIIIDSEGDWFIGSREELLYAKGDRTYPQKPPEARDIVDVLRTVADDYVAKPPKGQVRVYYLEVYGNNIGRAAKQYTGGSALGYRLFDVAHLDANVLSAPDMTREKASSWRKSGGLAFVSEEELREAAWGACVGRVPVLGTVAAPHLPKSREGMYEWLKDMLPNTFAALDKGGKGVSEGIVLRSSDRSVIAKARFADYQRTLGRG